MQKFLIAIACCVATAGTASMVGAAPVSGGLKSGIDLASIDPSVRPQDDLYRYTNGKWLAATEIPADKSSYDSFDIVFDRTQQQLRSIVDGLQQSADPADPDQRKIADLYATYMDEPALESAGLKPLADEFARIDALQTLGQVPALIAHFNRIGVDAPYAPQVHQDNKDSTKYVFDIGQSGIGLPDRDYYLGNEAQLKETREKYLVHIEKMLALAGAPAAQAKTDARSILALEKSLAKIQWTKVELRDPVKAYNKFEFAKLATLTPGYDWKAYLDAAGVTGKTDYVIVGQPTYVTAWAAVLKRTPLPVWRAYFRWQVLSHYAPYLNKALVDENFEFYGKTLTGAAEQRARWKRGISLVDGSIGEGLGKLYVARYFPPSAKARMEQLVGNLLEAYRQDIRTLDWMGPQTKEKAELKLSKFATKIGYPPRWRDYSALRIVKGDLVGDVMRANEFEYLRNVNKLGHPIDRDEWGMFPQTINAQYNPEQNDITFPAGILQPPFFDADADDAVNYGAIGSVIGHEISHGFDDQGSQYDGDGNLLSPPGWFTKDDLGRFQAKAHALVAQYAEYAPVPGYPINGELTLGENIADNSGLAIAYKAYELSLGGKPAPVIDGYTGEQRLFLGFAQVWRGKTRDAAAIVYIKADPHSPDQFRGLLPEMNLTPFDAAFDVKPGDKMYRPPEQRVSMW
jgi:predicted metalloendopeptidase